MSCLATAHGTIASGAIVLLILIQATPAAPTRQTDATEQLGDELSEADRTTKQLEDVYESLLKRIQDQPSITVRDVESLSFWSDRLLQAQMSAATLVLRQSVTAPKVEHIAAAVRGAFDAHVARLERVAQAADSRKADGKADSLAASAVDSLVRLAKLQRTALLESQQLEVQRDLDIVLLDRSDTRPATSRPRELVVSVDAQGQYHVKGKVVSLEELKAILKTAALSDPGRASVVIRADRKARSSVVAAAMNACKETGIDEFRATTRETTTED